MKCVYPNGIELTRDEAELVQETVIQITEIIIHVWNQVVELVKSIYHEVFKVFLELQGSKNKRLFILFE